MAWRRVHVTRGKRNGIRKQPGNHRDEQGIAAGPTSTTGSTDRLSWLKAMPGSGDLRRVVAPTHKTEPDRVLNELSARLEAELLHH